MSDFLKEQIGKLDIILTEQQLAQLNRYYELLVEKNKVMNLTAITEYEDVVIKHFVDSLAIVKTYDLSKVRTLLDVGTGAGFPGLVLAIAYPELKVTLLDSLNKRIGFLKEVAEELGLSGITFLHGRAEDYARDPKFREKYDLVVSRAVANLATLSEYCLPYVAVGKDFVSYKAGDSLEEIQAAGHAIQVLGGETVGNTEFVLPETDIARRFVIIRKKRKTSNEFPRKAGIPSKKPI